MLKKIIRLLVSWFLCFSCVFSLTGCLIIDSDSTIAQKNFEKLITAIQNKNKIAVKELFAKNKIANIENFDDAINALFTYYDGEYVSFKNKGVGMFSGKDRSGKYKYFSMSYDVTTTARVYRFGIKWYITETKDKNDVGIWFLYILKFEDDPYPQFSYGGDGLGTYGINVGKVWIDETI